MSSVMTLYFNTSQKPQKKKMANLEVTEKVGYIKRDKNSNARFISFFIIFVKFKDYPKAKRRKLLD